MSKIQQQLDDICRQQPPPLDSRAQVIEKLSEVLLGMDHATGDRNLQIWIATEGIQEVLTLLREEGSRP